MKKSTMSATTLEWKLEPASPLLDAERDAWLFFEDDVAEKNNLIVEQQAALSPTRAEVAQQLLDDIDDYVKKEESKEESFSDWFEEKVNLPIFDQIQSLLPTEEPAKPELSQELQELEYVFSHGQLTPPQSPPHEKEIQQTQSPVKTYNDASFILPDENVVQIALQPYSNQITYIPQNFIIEPVTQPTYITLLPAAAQENIAAEPSAPKTAEISYLTAPPTPIPDLEKEMAVVDEVVRNTVQNLDSNWDQWESETSQSEASSTSFNCSSPSVSTSNDCDESDDPEWMPEAAKTPGKATKTTKRSKPYSRSGTVEDKRLRKKEQNKNAATRYRMKKKAEVSEILEEEKQLEDKNAQLEQKVGDLKTEIKYLKGLMRDLFRAKGLIK